MAASSSVPDVACLAVECTAVVATVLPFAIRASHGKARVAAASPQAFAVPDSWIGGRGGGEAPWRRFSEGMDPSLQRLWVSLASVLMKPSAGDDDVSHELSFGVSKDEEGLGGGGGSLGIEERLRTHKKRGLREASGHTGEKASPPEAQTKAARGQERVSHGTQDGHWVPVGFRAEVFRRHPGDREVFAGVSQGRGPSQPFDDAHVHENSSQVQKAAKEPAISAAAKREPSGSSSSRLKAQISSTREELLKYLQEQSAKTSQQRRAEELLDAAAGGESREPRELGSLELLDVGERVRGASPWPREEFKSPELTTQAFQPSAADHALHRTTAVDLAVEGGGPGAHGALRSRELPESREQVIGACGRRAAAASAAKDKPENWQEGVLLCNERGGSRNFEGRLHAAGQGEVLGESFSSTVASSSWPSSQQEPLAEGRPLLRDHSVPLRQRHRPIMHESHEPEEPGDAGNAVHSSAIGASLVEKTRTGPMTCRRRTRLLTVSLDPSLPILLQSPPSEPEGLNRNSAFDRPQPQGESPDLLQQLGGPKPGDNKGSPVQRAALLDPYASPLAATREPHSVFWGRSGAFGASGTPMVSPRQLEGAQGLTRDDIDLQRKSALPFGTERFFQKSPNVTLRSVGIDGSAQGGVELASWRDRGERMHTGARKFFGTPSLDCRQLQVSSGQDGKKMREDIARLREFALRRRGRCADPKPVTASTEASTRAPQQSLHGETAVRPWAPRGDSDAEDLCRHPPAGRAEWADEVAALAGLGRKGFSRPHFARQGGIGGGRNTPMVAIQSLEGASSPEHTNTRSLSPIRRHADSVSVNFLRRHRHSLGAAQTDVDPGELFYRDSSVGTSGSPWEGWDPYPKT